MRRFNSSLPMFPKKKNLLSRCNYLRLRRRHRRRSLRHPCHNATHIAYNGLICYNLCSIDQPSSFSFQSPTVEVDIETLTRTDHGQDMIRRARTVTGNTLAFGIPVLDKIISYNEKHGKERNPLAIVLVSANRC